jgi:hypothetical protein
MKKTFFSIADNNNLPYYEKMKASLQKFHPDISLILIDQEKIKQLGDPHFFYRATPIIAKGLFKTYDAVCKIDADTIITGNLDHIWEDDYDVAVVRNSNPREHNSYPIRLIDIHPFSYANAGFVVMKSPVFVEHWLKLCMSAHFNNFQYKEQDLLNIMIFYMGEQFGGPYKVRFLDDDKYFHGLASKGYWPEIELQDKELVLKPTKDGDVVYPDKERVIKAIHFAGGNQPNKMNYKAYFRPDVSKRLDELIK